MEVSNKVPAGGEFCMRNTFSDPVGIIVEDEKVSGFKTSSVIYKQQELLDFPFLSDAKSVKSDCSSPNPFTFKSHSSEHSSKKKEKLTNSNDNSKFSFVSDTESPNSCKSSEKEAETTVTVQDSDIKLKKCCLCVIL